MLVKQATTMLLLEVGESVCSKSNWTFFSYIFSLAVNLFLVLNLAAILNDQFEGKLNIKKFEEDTR